MLKDQRVSHTAITENKRLWEALAFIKAQQDVAYSPKVKTNSEKDGYRKKERNAPGHPNSVSCSAAPADPTALTMTFLLCTRCDISTWLQQRARGEYS